MAVENLFPLQMSARCARFELVELISHLLARDFTRGSYGWVKFLQRLQQGCEQALELLPAAVEVILEVGGNGAARKHRNEFLFWAEQVAESQSILPHPACKTRFDQRGRESRPHRRRPPKQMFIDDLHLREIRRLRR